MVRAVAVMLLVPTLAAAEDQGESYFVAADPHVPLAVVQRGTIRSAVATTAKGCGAPERWAKAGTSWRALDGWGQVVGTAVVEFVDEAATTGCGELVFAPKFHRHSGRYVFVSQDSAFVPSPPLRWQAPQKVHHAFEALVDDTLKGAPQTRQAERCTDLPERSRYFQLGSRKLAVGGGEGGYVIATFESGKWLAESKQLTPPAGRERSACYRPVSVFDLNGDGRPEIVMRYFEVDVWGDVVLTRSERGKWTVVAQSPGGSRA